jgi:arylsulfatase A-like enzyme
LCGAPGGASSLLLVTVDTLRADALGAYGGPLGATPTLDRLAREGVVFEQVMTQAPATGPAVASLMTSRYPHEHGVVHSTKVLPGSAETLAEMLAAYGYRTAGFVSSSIVAARYGFRQGFDEWDEETSRPYTPDHAERDARETTEAALRWLSRQRHPFFLWVHYFDPHGPYIEHSDDPGAGRVITGDFISQLAKSGSRKLIERHRGEIRRVYQGEVSWVDLQIGKILDRLTERGVLERTLVAVTADHGQELFDYGTVHGHVRWLSERVLHVPLILRQPSRLPSGRRVSGAVQSIDIGPTLLALLGVPQPAGLSGRDQTPAIDAGETPGTSVAIAQREP